METSTIEITEGGFNGKFHIEGQGNGFITLCGFVDVHHEIHDYEDHPVDCRVCIAEFKRIRAMKVPRGYFAKMEAK